MLIEVKILISALGFLFTLLAWGIKRLDNRFDKIEKTIDEKLDDNNILNNLRLENITIKIENNEKEIENIKLKIENCKNKN